MITIINWKGLSNSVDLVADVASYVIDVMCLAVIVVVSIIIVSRF